MTIFNSRHLLQVQAESNGHVIIERTFTYEELKALDFRIEVTEGAQPTPGVTP